MAAPALPANLARALTYGPQSGKAVRRSQYLTDALEAMTKGQASNIQTPGELAAKLLATAILKRGSDRASDSALEALNADRQTQAGSLLAALRGPEEMAAPVEPPMAPPMQPPAQPQPQPMMGPGGSNAAPPTMATAPARQPVEMRPLPSAMTGPAPGAPNVDAVWRAAIKQESGDRPGVLGPMTEYGQAQGMTQMLPATAREMASKLGVPWRPELMTGTSPEAAAYQERLGRAYFEEGLQRYGGDVEKAIAYYHGGPNEDIWGPKTRAHVDAVMRRVPQQGEMPAGSYQLAQNTVSAPGQMAGDGMAPPPGPPQAPGGGASPSATYWKPNPQQIALVEQLLADPRTYDQGVQMAYQLRAKMAEPIPYEIQTINGVPFYVPKTPGAGSMQAIPVPQAAQTQLMPAQQAGIATAPQGLYVQRDPLGNLKDAPGAPPAGYNAGPDGYSPIRGGPNDPYRVQAPPQGYQFQGGAHVAIPGGPADPRNAQNVLEGTKTIRNEIAPVIDSALKLKRSVDSVRVGYSQQGGAGDIAMINGLQRMIDEGVVREGDVALQLQGQGLAGSISGLKGYMTSEGFFSDPKVRDAVLATAENLFGQVNENYRQRAMGYRSIVDGTYGEGAFDRYVFPSDMAASVGWNEARPAPGAPPPAGAASPAAAAKAGSREAQLRLAIERGLPLTASELEEARRMGLAR